MVRIQSSDGTTTKLEWNAFCPGGVFAAPAASTIIGEIIQDVMNASEELKALEEEGARYDLPLKTPGIDAVIMKPEGSGILFSYSANIKPLEGQGVVSDKLRELRFIPKA